ncbi:MAG: nitrite reductase, copper-containing [Anaerolineae bacterium]|nr:nitrite reductase, copper-containing [Anaerolineae bacterium]
MIGLLLAAVFVLSACAGKSSTITPPPTTKEKKTLQQPAPIAQQPAAQVQPSEPQAQQAEPIAQTEANVSYTLVTSSDTYGLAFIGKGGDIDGVVNPTLTAKPGDTVEITVINGDGMLHDLTIDEFNQTTGQMTEKGTQVTLKFTVDQAGSYVYYCAVPGHRQAGMWGTLQVGEAASGTTAQVAQGENVVHHPADIPAEIGEREPQIVRVELEAKEVIGQLSDGTTYGYFTFNGTVPGPMLRVRLGDTVELKLSNAAESLFSHSIDLHAVNGPGGGMVYTETKPGEENVFTFKPLAVGLYVYHCATPSVPHHISNGMYGMILVEPEEGLPPVDKEYYVMQGELYTEQAYGSTGQLDFSADKMSHEMPEYYIFNGSDKGLTKDENVLTAKVGEVVRIFFGVGGPNKTSSFHVIGEIFDRVYSFASLTSAPLTNVQTVTVPPGGAVMVEFRVDVPGTYLLVDHALSRTERGLVGYRVVDGPEQPDICRKGPANP